MAHRAQALEPRKTPSQQRSTVTVEAILEATVRVLEQDGNAFTTTRVATVAGVSVGSLYQYFPNKQALVAALMRRKLDEVVAVVAAVADVAPADPERAAAAVMEAVLAEKRRTMRLTEALAAPKASLDGRRLVAEMALQVQGILSAMLSDRRGVPLTDAEQRRLAVALAAVEGAMTRMVEADPDMLMAPDMAGKLTAIFLSTLDLSAAAAPVAAGRG